jgi:PhnB protein
MKPDSHKPPGWPAVIPRIVASNPKELVEFIKYVFDAKGDFLKERPSILEIQDSKIMVSESGIRNVTPAFLYVYVPNADETYQRAIRAGAKSLEEPAQTPYGDRRAMIEDQWGNTWQIASYKNATEE